MTTKDLIRSLHHIAWIQQLDGTLKEVLQANGMIYLASASQPIGGYGSRDGRECCKASQLDYFLSTQDVIR